MPAKKKTKEESGPSIQSGIYMFPNGDKYEGDYIQSEIDGTIERQGTGTHTTSEGTVYVGLWMGDKMNGQGKILFTSEAVYEGDFVNNQFHGTGRYTWPNGSFYEGQFNENKMEGDGDFTDTDSQVWTGTFRYKAAPGLRFKLGAA